MSQSRSGQRDRNPYLSLDSQRDAVEALEHTAFFLEKARTDIDWWKWAIVALHNAVQGFMVLALQGSWNVTVLRRDQRERKLRAYQEHLQALDAGDKEAAHAANQVMLFGDAELAPFEELYGRIKSNDQGMLQFMDSRCYEPRPTDDQCMECLDDLRNELLHFVPSGRHFLLTRFPAVTETGLHIISFLVNESNNIRWFEPGRHGRLKVRVERALTESEKTLSRIVTDYADLPRPAPPFCGSEPDMP
jgi:hypothetical protein